MTPESPPVTAVSAIVIRNGRFLLVRRANPPSRDMFAFAGGRIEPGEAHLDAALRELREETGLEGWNPRLHSIHHITHAGSPDADHPDFSLAAYRVDVGADAVATAGGDAAALGWYTAAETRCLSMPESVRACIETLSGAAPEPR